MGKHGTPLATRDWAEGLPRELLGSVLDLLTAGDHAHFAAVCAAWNSVAGEARRRPAPQAPWVLLNPPFEEEEEAEEGTHGSFQFMRPYDGKVHAIRRPLPHDFRWKRVVGISPDGWLTLVNKRGELRALNPVTDGRLRLPRMVTIPKGYAKTCAKAVMSSLYAHRPTSPVFMVFLRNGRRKSAVALATAGDKKWSLLDTSALAEIYDLAYHAGEFYILGKPCAGNPGEQAICIAVVGRGGRDPSSPPEIMVVEPICPWHYNHHLVGSTLGDLLLVFSSLDADYKIYRLNVVRGGDGGRVMRSVQVGDLGDHAVVLAQECSMLVSTLQVPELRRNHVYFICKFYQLIFNMEEESTISLERRIEAGWFMPGVL